MSEDPIDRELSERHARLLAAWGWKRATGRNVVWSVAYGRPQAISRDLLRSDRLWARVGAWDDHGKLYYRSADGAYLWATEPYGLWNESMADLLAFCDEHGLACHVDVRGTHYPTGCLSIWLVKQRVPLGLPEPSGGNAPHSPTDAADEQP